MRATGEVCLKYFVIVRSGDFVILFPQDLS
jgi:hypothetical protein